jgi:hypothetical protein
MAHRGTTEAVKALVICFPRLDGLLDVLVVLVFRIGPETLLKKRAPGPSDDKLT